MEWIFPFSGEEVIKSFSRALSDIRFHTVDFKSGNLFLRCKVRSTPANIYDITNLYLHEYYIPVDPYSFLVLVEENIGKNSKSYIFQFSQFVPTVFGRLGYVDVYPINDQFIEISIGTNVGYIQFDQEGYEPKIKYKRVREFIASFADYVEHLFSSKRETEITFKVANKDQEPNSRTQLRFEVFRKLKEQHPTWSQARVAMEACQDLGEVVTADTVRNSYRSMKVKWPRSDRVR
jgi:hypothetical protein